MCGICGILDVTSQQRADFALVRQMAEAIRHRGPDGDGFYDAPNVSLGMRRLSIIDVEGSDQPLYNEDQSIAMVFNGEIYNYCELREDLQKRGHMLRTAGDGETVIHLYEDYGLDVFRYLRGMYAFALWDSRNDRLVLAVDHIGMKPLYLHERDGKLLFASEAKAFFADPDMPRTLNLGVLDTFFSFGYPVGEETLFDGVQRLPPGHALVAEKGRTFLHPYWIFGEGFIPGSAAASNGATRQYQEADDNVIIEDARRLIADSLNIHLRSDVPLGLFLSGGIDSTAILGLMSQKASGRIKTFTVGYDLTTQDNELIPARRSTEYFEAEHYELIISPEQWWDGLEKYAYYHDEPNANPSAISLMLLAEMAAKHVKVVLTGLGGDELFGGYSSHSALPFLMRRRETWRQLMSVFGPPLKWIEQYYPLFKRYRIIGAIPTYLPHVRHSLLPIEEGLMRMQSFDGMVFSDSLRERLYGPDLKAAWMRERHKENTYHRIFERSWRDDPHDMAQALVINSWLAGNGLLSQDKTAMAHALEARVPFFDPVLFDFAARVPSAVRMRSNKYVLRNAMRPYLPEFALNRPKQPFGTPIRGWFERELIGRIQDVLLDPGALSRRLLNESALEKLLRRHFSGAEKHEEVIFRLLNLELWHRQFMQTARESQLC